LNGIAVWSYKKVNWYKLWTLLGVPQPRLWSGFDGALTRLKKEDGYNALVLL
jgi:hypothetical protein